MVMDYVCPSYRVQNEYTGSGLVNNASSITMTTLLQALMTPPYSAVLLNILVLFSSRNVELPIKAATYC